ncbi:MAG TPA: hypothetical protein VFX30_14630, partial [bacterium]|nr:hypothetical protein [bacterium]
KELAKSLTKLTSSDYYQLNKAFDESVGRAEAVVEPLTFELTSRQLQAGKEKPIDFRVRVKSLDELNLDANDPAGSLAKLDPKELIVVEVRTTDEAQKNEIEKAIKDKGWEDLPVTVTSAEAPAKTQPSATSSFAVAGPAMGAMGLFEQLSSWGLSPLGAGLLTGVAVLGSTVAMGMAFNGRFNRAPEPLEMKQGGLPKTLGPSHDVVVKYRPDAPGGGSFVLINGPENNGRKSSTPVFVNGRDVSGKKFQVLGPTAEITIGDRTYSFKDMTPPSAKSSEYVTERPYFGERATGIFRVSGSNTAKNDAAFRTVQTGDSGTVTFLVQGKGKTAAQLGAVSEVDTAIGNSVEAGMKVEDIVNGARPQAQMFVAIPTLMPKIDVMAVELKPNADDATKFDPRFIASGPDTSKMNDTGLEAWVFHPSNTNEAIFKASGYVSSPDKPLDTGDVIICGRLSEMFSEKFLGDVVGRLSQGGRVPTNVEIQGALIQEARVRSKMLENAGGKDVVLTQAAYNKAFTDLYGNGTPLTYKGLYSGDANALSGTIEYYTLKSDGSVVDYRGKTVDHFKAESEGIGFMVQVVGSK